MPYSAGPLPPPHMHVPQAPPRGPEHSLLPLPHLHVPQPQRQIQLLWLQGARQVGLGQRHAHRQRLQGRVLQGRAAGEGRTGGVSDSAAQVCWQVVLGPWRQHPGQR